MARSPSYDEIRQLAHQLWIERGRPEGSPQVDWERAEGLLRMSPNAASPPAQPVAVPGKAASGKPGAEGGRLADVPIRVPPDNRPRSNPSRAKANGSMPAARPLRNE